MKPSKLALLLMVMTIGNQVIAKNVSSQSKPTHQKYTLIDLGTLGGPNSFFNGGPPAVINNRGMIGAEADTAVPCSYFPGFVSPAVTRDSGVLTNLGLLPGGCFSLPNAINSKGVLVGSGDIGVIDPIAGVPEIRADLRYGGSVLDLGTFGGNNSLANDVNEADQVVGGAQNTEPDLWNFGDILGLPSSTAWHGFVWQEGRMQDLGTLGGPDSFALSSTRRARLRDSRSQTLSQMRLREFPHLTRSSGSMAR